MGLSVEGGNLSADDTITVDISADKTGTVTVTAGGKATGVKFTVTQTGKGFYSVTADVSGVTDDKIKAAWSGVTANFSVDGPKAVYYKHLMCIRDRYLGVHRRSAIDSRDTDARLIFGKFAHLVGDLHGKLARGRKHQHLRRFQPAFDPLYGGDAKRSRFTSAGARAADYIGPLPVSYTHLDVYKRQD